ncbi:MAG: hypothetical protein PHS33_07550 [Candidatus Omnitrophica bacterium]|nr:hypothetical protein [Candidatus Omnitrophota bacterium]
MNKVSDKYIRDLLREIVSFRAGGVCEFPGCKNTECDPRHFFSKDSLSVRYSYESCLWLCQAHHTGRISAHSEPLIFEAMIIYYQVRTIEWLQEVIDRKNQIITVAPEIYREEWKEKLLAELKRLGVRGWRV